MTTLLVDFQNLIFRAFFGTYRGEGQPILRAPDGSPTNAIATTSSMLGGLARQFPADRIIFCLEGSPVFRRRIFPDYKGTRDEKPPLLASQLPVFTEIIQNFGFETAHNAEEEADDVLATLARRFGADGEVLIATGDKDLLQMVGGTVSVLRPIKGGIWERWGVSEVQNAFKVSPAAFANYLALVGDKADNIPGIAGIGPVGAVELLHDLPTFSVLAQRVADRRKLPLDEARAKLDLALSLTTVRAGVDCGLSRLEGRVPEARAKLQALNCDRAIEALARLAPSEGRVESPAPVEVRAVQGMLF